MHLGDSEIHVWTALLDDFHDDPSRFDRFLSADERIRAGKFHFARDCDRFVAGRGILRALLARYLARDAAAIEFSYGRFGKPELAAPEASRPLYFNASRSGALAVYAVTRACPVGVDVERLREVPDFEAVASRFLAPSEACRLMSLPLDRRVEAFFACWTDQEAFLKATGEGIGVRLGTCPTPDWRLQRLWPAPGYAGAVAYRHGAARLCLWRVSDVTLQPGEA